MSQRLSQQYVEEQFEQKGCKLLDTYKNKDIPVKFRCKCGEISTICYGSFRRGSHCLSCSGKRKHTLGKIKEQIEQEGYLLLSNEYQSAFAVMDIQCPEGHTYQSHWNNFQQGRRCPECAKQTAGDHLRLDCEEVKKVFEEANCELLSKEYHGCHKNLKYRCVCGRVSHTTFSHFKNGHRCARCRADNMKGDKHPLWIKDRKEAKLRREITTKCFSALRSTMLATKQNKYSKSYKLLGYTPKELRKRVEYHPNWIKLNGKKWHLDHVFPIKSFCDYEITDISLINCLENLRPMEGRENLKKSAKYNQEDFERWLETKGYEIIEV